MRVEGQESRARKTLRTQDRGRIAHELHMEIYKVFNQQGVEIPYMKQDVHIKEWPAIEGLITKEEEGI